MANVHPKGIVVKCDTCQNELEYVGNPIPFDDNAHTWRGTVCLTCKHVYCDKCNEVNPVPCPQCGNRLTSAMTVYLRQAGKLA